MKRFLILILSIMLGIGCLLLTACGNDDESPSGAEEQSVSEQSNEEKTSRTVVQPISDGGGFQGGDYMN